MGKINEEELATMVESTMGKLPEEKKVDLLTKIVIFLLLVLLHNFSSHNEETETYLEAEITRGLHYLVSRYH